MKTSSKEIRNRKLASDLFHKVEEDMKPSHCLLCGKKKYIILLLSCSTTVYISIKIAERMPGYSCV